MTRERILTLTDISKSYKTGEEKIHVLREVTLSLRRNECIGLMGPSGCGKSTLLNIAGLLDQADTGSVLLGETDVPQGPGFKKNSDLILSRLRMAHIGFVFQFHHLLSDFTAIENVMLPMLLAGKWSRRERQERAEHLLDSLAMSPRKHHYPAELSGGERQRVAIARALANQPSLVLADEPTGNLDEENGADVFHLFMTAVKEENMALMIVSHNQSLLDSLDQVYQLRQGRLEAWK